MNIVKLLQQQNERLVRVEENKKKISTEIVTHIEVYQCNQQAANTAVAQVGIQGTGHKPPSHRRHRGSPPRDSSDGSNSHSTPPCVCGHPRKFQSPR